MQATPVQAYPRFASAIEALDPPLPHGARVLVAVSAGADSLALLHLFTRLRARRRPDLALWLGHVHHGLRGPEAEAAAQLCLTQAQELDLGHVEARVDVAALTHARTLSTEMAARELRFACFARWARELDLHAIALAHHADDQAETVLSNLLRGTGLAGLRGMRTERPLGAGSTRLLRPLLSHTRIELREFLRTTGVQPVEDSTNHDLAHQRNRIRHELLPFLTRRYQAGASRALERLAEEAARVEELRRNASLHALQAVRWGPGVAAIPRAALSVDPAVQGHVLSDMWHRCTSAAALGRAHHHGWRRLIEASGSGTRIDLPRGWTIERAAGWLFLRRADTTSPPVLELEPGRARVAAWGLEISIAALSPDALSPDDLSPGEARTVSLAFRATRGEDRLRLPDGAQCRVRELLRGRGLPVQFRAIYPVLAQGSEVLWVPGIAVTPQAESLVRQVLVDAQTSPAGFMLAQLIDPRC